LWATHLIDEVGGEDRVIVLHQGRMLAFDDAARVIRDAGAKTMTEAFTNLTGKGGA
jgi:ABC-2 type transport system ATP-binding protein